MNHLYVASMYSETVIRLCKQMRSRMAEPRNTLIRLDLADEITRLLDTYLSMMQELARVPREDIERPDFNGAGLVKKVSLAISDVSQLKLLMRDSGDLRLQYACHLLTHPCPVPDKESEHYALDPLYYVWSKLSKIGHLQLLRHQWERRKKLPPM